MELLLLSCDSADTHSTPIIPVFSPIFPLPTPSLYFKPETIPREVTSSIGYSLCPFLSFSVNPKDEECKPCPAMKFVQVGCFLHLDAGYWRSSELSSDVYLCPIPSACLGDRTPTVQRALVISSVWNVPKVLFSGSQFLCWVRKSHYQSYSKCPVNHLSCLSLHTTLKQGNINISKNDLYCSKRCLIEYQRYPRLLTNTLLVINSDLISYSRE